MKHITPYHENRPWGEFIEFSRNTPSTVKIITVKAGESLSLQTHKNRDEFWFVLSGTGIVQTGSQKFETKPGDTYNIPRTTPHRLTGTTDLQILEISAGEFDDNDIIRLEDNYGRS